jgi:metal-dependent amidase/aminoacylase/carboxypeptidase family protein
VKADCAQLTTSVAELVEMSHLLAAEPELAWEEHKSHDRLSALCERLGFTVTRHFQEHCDFV